MVEAQPILVMRDIVKDYGEGRARALDSVNLSVDAGAFAAIIGPSGSGKSTLLNLIGLLDRPTQGTMQMLGADVLALTPGQLTAFRGSKLGFVFQFHHLLPGFTAAENVMLPLMAHAGRERAGMRSKALETLALVGMEHLADAAVPKLSGGQQQRVAMARALAADPVLLLADEPTGNLDTRNADEIFTLLRRLNQDKGLTVLVVTHDSRLAARCDRRIEVVDGHVRP